MILVTVGTHTQGFVRLVQKMDEIAAKLEQEVVMQIGVTDYIPQNARYFRFVDQSEMERLNQEAVVVVTHAGAGSILTALLWSKPVIVVPRLVKFGEHKDDHQLQIAEALSETGKVVAVFDVESLEDALAQAQDFSPPSPSPGTSRLVGALENYVSHFAARISPHPRQGEETET